jgi:hypothetical protein
LVRTVIRLAPLLAAVAAALFSLLAWQQLRVPVFWIALAWTVVCSVCFSRARARAWRAVWFNLGAVILILGLADAYVGFGEEGGPQTRQEFSNGGGFFVTEREMGHRPAAGATTMARMYYGDEQIYDVVYTINADGLRISPPEAPTDPARCVLFMGDSYTFGEGVNDDETMPYQVGIKTHAQWRVRNFGFSGYGPHHMLAALETGLVERAAQCDPQYVIYQVHPHNVLRSAGKWWWDRYGPRYVLQPDGRVVREGNFSDHAMPGWVSGFVEQSALAHRIEDNPTTTPADVDLFNAIVKRSRGLLEERYPGIQFVVLYWDVTDGEVFTRMFNDGSATEQFVIHPMSHILPDWNHMQEKYTLPHDVHPNALAHGIIADYVVTHVLQTERPPGGAG